MPVTGQVVPKPYGRLISLLRKPSASVEPVWHMIISAALRSNVRNKEIDFRYVARSEPQVRAANANHPSLVRDHTILHPNTHFSSTLISSIDMDEIDVEPGIIGIAPVIFARKIIEIEHNLHRVMRCLRRSSYQMIIDVKFDTLG